jgi:hypothetical protein
VSAIRAFRLHSDTAKIERVVSVTNGVHYQKDSSFVVDELSPGSNYSMAVTAIGCENSSSTTEYFHVSTRPFVPGSIKVCLCEFFSDNFMAKHVLYLQVFTLKGRASDQSHVLILNLTESRINIQYANILAYKINGILLPAAEIFDQETLQPLPGYCLNAKYGSSTNFSNPAPKSSCLLSLDLPPRERQEGLTFQSLPYDNVVEIQLDSQSSSFLHPFVLVLICLLLLLTGIIMTFAIFRLKSKQHLEELQAANEEGNLPLQNVPEDIVASIGVASNEQNMRNHRYEQVDNGEDTEDVENIAMYEQVDVTEENRPCTYVYYSTGSK